MGWHNGVGLILLLVLFPLQAAQRCLDRETCLPGPAIRVAALTWSAAEMLLTLGVTPIGVTEQKGYRRWQSNYPPLPEGIAELGRRQEPSFAALARQQPDLVIGLEFRHARLSAPLAAIAPLYLYQQYPRPGQTDFRYFDQMQRVFMTLARAVGREELGRQKLANMHQRLGALRAQLASAGLAGSPLQLGKLVGMGYGLRMFGTPSLAATVAVELGLDYRWQRVLPGRDFTHLQLEQVGELEDIPLLLVARPEEYAGRMLGSRVWQMLPQVRGGKVAPIDDRWSYGGPLSAIRMAEAITEAMLAMARLPLAKGEQ